MNLDNDTVPLRRQPSKKVTCYACNGSGQMEAGRCGPCAGTGQRTVEAKPGKGSSP